MAEDLISPTVSPAIALAMSRALSESPDSRPSSQPGTLADARSDAGERTLELPSVGKLASVGIKPGDVLASRYQIEATLGDGGSGQVFRAWDRVLGEPIALKILHAERACEKSWIRRLAREVKVARAIRHANVCRVFDLGAADGHWFISMELATAGTLRDTLRANADRTLDEKLADARAVCAGLAAIHAVGIIHRDVTPQNVLRMTDGRLVLSDFGLAIEGADTTTVHGGTPRYMPPESAMGQRSDQRSDVWQLGAILHELLFGRRPEWQTEASGIRLRLPASPDAPPVELELAWLCAECLEQNPAERPQTAIDVAARLAAAELERPRRRLGRWLERYRWRWRRVWYASAVFVAAAALGAFITHWVLQRRVPPAAVRAAALSDQDRTFLRRMSRALDLDGRHDDARRLSGIADRVPAH